MPFTPIAHGILSPYLLTNLVGCRWVYRVKVRLDGLVDCLKARLVVKGYAQKYG